MRTEAEFLALVESRLTPRRHSAPRAVLIAATAAVLLAAAMTGAIILSRARAELGQPETATGPAVHVDTNRPELSPEQIPDLPIPWEQVYRDARYSLTQAAPLPLTADDIGQSLGGNLYALKGVSAAYFLLCAAGEDYWGYFNYAYTPTTLGALIADLNLIEMLEIGSLYYETIESGQYRTWRIEGLDANRVRSMLFAYSSSIPQRLTVRLDPEKIVEEAKANGETVTPPYDPTGEYIVDRTVARDISVGISLPKLGFNNISISLSDEDSGWLWTNLLAHGNYFATSPTLVDDLLAYAHENGNWIDTTPVYAPGAVGIPE